MFKNFINRPAKPSFATILWNFIDPYLQYGSQNFLHLITKAAFFGSKNKI